MVKTPITSGQSPCKHLNMTRFIWQTVQKPNIQFTITLNKEKQQIQNSLEAWSRKDSAFFPWKMNEMMNRLSKLSTVSLSLWIDFLNNKILFQHLLPKLFRDYSIQNTLINIYLILNTWHIKFPNKADGKC